MRSRTRVFLPAALRLLALTLVTAWLFAPFAALAQEAPAQSVPSGEEPPVTKPCASCHSDETAAWRNSPHAMPANPSTFDPAATCESCHGEYVRGHPDSGVVELRVDSSMCKDCHEDTYVEWQNSIHGQENVQCISCHEAHSQEMRLTDDRLCESCHKESLGDSLHTAHWGTEATCTTCHASIGDESAARAAGHVPAPNHDFISVSSTGCLDCHREDVQSDGATVAAADPKASAAQEIAAANADLERTLDRERTENKALATLSVTNLGLGVGVGGVLGIVFMLLLVRYSGR
jgi:hypothetical protein